MENNLTMTYRMNRFVLYLKGSCEVAKQIIYISGTGCLKHRRHQMGHQVGRLENCMWVGILCILSSPSTAKGVSATDEEYGIGLDLF